MELTTADFDYGSVDEDTAAKLEYFAKSGHALIRKSQIQFIADMGKLLSEARECMSHHGNGKFVKWATAEFDIGKQTVFNYLNAWEKCLSNGWTNFANWSPTALYLASSETIPGPVQKKLKKISNGKPVRASDVKRLIESSKPEPQPEEEPAEVCDTETQVAEVEEAAEEFPVDIPEPVTPPSQPETGKKNGTPPRQFDNSHWLRQWNQSIGPIVRMVDKIAKDVESNGRGSHRIVQQLLNEATEEVEAWLK